MDLSARLLLNDGQSISLSSDTADILRKCVDPTGTPAVTTGLVTGYVQSGKTRSIESVLCVARDSGYRMAIVLTGTSNNLLTQSRGRLERDLGVEDGASELGWTTIHKPSIAHEDLLRDMLASWTDGRPVWNRRTPILFVLKNATNIAKLAELLSKLELSDVPALVVDDEADQASLDNNARRRVAPTATYAGIEKMRAALPWHSYLQYTATPQAPLLISISDALSPKFVHVLVPGEGYTGGRTFFGKSRKIDQIRTIDQADLAATIADKVPRTLKKAFRTYLIGVAAGLSTGERPKPRNRSMFVHPSRNRVPHETYETWIKLLKEEWLSMLDLDETERERIDLLSEFKDAYTDLASTTTDLPTFEDVAAILPESISQVHVKVVNGLNTEEIRWKMSYAWVIIGGQSIDRGFTIEGLTVSYVPRPIGEGNADNFQQRARFFGYRQNYLSLCRVFMDDDSKGAFESYVEHEEFMRDELQVVQAKGTSLKEWKRIFLLDERLRPTRNSVLSNGYFRTKLTGWLYPRYPHIEQAHVRHNNDVIDALVSDLDLLEDVSYPRHLSGAVPLAKLVESIWSMEFAADADSRRHAATILGLKRIVENDPAASASVLAMDKLQTRDRLERENSRLVINPMQGRDPSGKSRYPGDEKLRTGDAVTVQIHNLRTKTIEGVVVDKVMLIAVRIPSTLSNTFVVQD